MILKHSIFSCCVRPVWEYVDCLLSTFLVVRVFACIYVCTSIICACWNESYATRLADFAFAWMLMRIIVEHNWWDYDTFQSTNLNCFKGCHGVMVGRAIVNSPFYWGNTDSKLYGTSNPGKRRFSVLILIFFLILIPILFFFLFLASTRWTTSSFESFLF